MKEDFGCIPTAADWLARDHAGAVDVLARPPRKLDRLQATHPAAAA